MDINNHPESEEKFLLALHSSTDALGVGVLKLGSKSQEQKTAVFPLGRKLSNELFNCIEEILPSEYWNRISRISVATGPGGFTGTRLTIALARTLAQQLICPLDGFSSFYLMVNRLSKLLGTEKKLGPFWITTHLKRRGIIAGKYQIEYSHNNFIKNIIEIEKPHLIAENNNLYPSLVATDDIQKDIIELINHCHFAYKMKKESPWQKVLPIYPTSPVDNLNEK